MNDNFSISRISLIRHSLASVLAIACYLIAPLALAQSQLAADPGRKFGHLSEKNLDLSGAVTSGELKIWRVWQGDKQRWSFNPQHDDLVFEGNSGRSAFGEILPQKISRGPHTWTLPSSGLVYHRSATNPSNTPSTTPATQNLIASHPEISYCASAGEEVIDRIAVNAEGFKFITMADRSWSQYARDGRLLSFGINQLLIGQIKWDSTNNRKRAIADAADREVLFFDYDSQGRVERIRDHQSYQVTYSYNGSNLIEDVVDSVGVRTHYEYQNGNMFRKTVGSLIGVPPGQERSHQTVLTYAYDSAGQYKSWRDGDGVGADFDYAYDNATKRFTHTRTFTNGRSRRVVTDVDGYTVSIQDGGEYSLRLDRVCEDYAIIDASNRIT